MTDEKKPSLMRSTWSFFTGSTASILAQVASKDALAHFAGNSLPKQIITNGINAGYGAFVAAVMNYAIDREVSSLKNCVITFVYGSVIGGGADCFTKFYLEPYVGSFWAQGITGVVSSAVAVSAHQWFNRNDINNAKRATVRYESTLALPISAQNNANYQTFNAQDNDEQKSSTSQQDVVHVENGTSAGVKSDTNYQAFLGQEQEEDEQPLISRDQDVTQDDQSQAQEARHRVWGKRSSQS